MEGILGIDKLYKSKKLDVKDIKKAINGDKNAFTNIIKDNKEYLYKTAYMYVKDEAKALEYFKKQ